MGVIRDLKVSFTAVMQVCAEQTTSLKTMTSTSRSAPGVKSSATESDPPDVARRYETPRDVAPVGLIFDGSRGPDRPPVTRHFCAFAQALLQIT